MVERQRESVESYIEMFFSAVCSFSIVTVIFAAQYYSQDRTKKEKWHCFHSPLHFPHISEIDYIVTIA